MQKRSIAITVILLIVKMSLTSPVQAQTTEPVEGYFEYPMYEGYRLDLCLYWMSQCGEDAATAWCQKMGFTRAVYWEEDPEIGLQFPTRLIGSGRICAKRFCSGFRVIQCGNGRIPGVYLDGAPF